jgi:hypothetical protein
MTLVAFVMFVPFRSDLVSIIAQAPLEMQKASGFFVANGTMDI